MNKVGGWVGALGLMPLAAHALGGEGLVGGVLFSLGLLLVVVLGGLWGLWGLFWRSKWRWLLGSLAGALAGTVWLSLQICRPGVYGQACLSVGGRETALPGHWTSCSWRLCCSCWLWPLGLDWSWLS